MVAHGYSHWALGHLSGATQRGSLNLNRLPTDTVLFNWKTEIEADALAGFLTIGTMKRKGCDLLLGSMGIWVCFHVLETIEKLQSLLPEEMPPRNFSETHPPISLRKSAFIERYQDKDAAQNLFSAIDHIFETLWEYFLKFFEILKQFANDHRSDRNMLRFDTIQRLLYSICLV